MFGNQSEDAREEEEEEEFEIEEIVDDKKVKGKASYLVKWKGYSSDQNTWESKDDLEEDGYNAEIEQYEREKKPPTKMKSGKNRSKSPAARAKMPSSNSLGEEESEKEEGNEEKSSVAKSNENQITYLTQSTSIPGSRSAIRLFRDDMLAFSLVINFSLAAILSLVLDSISRTMTTVPLAFKLTQLIVDPIPIIMCMFTVFYKVPSSAFSNRVCASLLWMATTIILETLQRTGVLAQVSSAPDTFDQSRPFILISIFLAHLMLALAVSVDNIPTHFIIFLLGAYGLVVAFYYFPTHISTTIIHGSTTGSNLESMWRAQFSIIALCVYSLVRAVSRIINFGEEATLRKDTLPEWLDFLSVVMQIMVAIITVLQEDHIIDLGVPEKFVVSNWPTGETLEINGIWLTKSAMRWIVALSLCLSSMVRVQPSILTPGIKP